MQKHQNDSSSVISDVHISRRWWICYEACLPLSFPWSLSASQDRIQTAVCDCNADVYPVCVCVHVRVCVCFGLFTLSPASSIPPLTYDSVLKETLSHSKSKIFFFFSGVVDKRTSLNKGESPANMWRRRKEEGGGQRPITDAGVSRLKWGNTKKEGRKQRGGDGGWPLSPAIHRGFRAHSLSWPETHTHTRDCLRLHLKPRSSYKIV